MRAPPPGACLADRSWTCPACRAVHDRDHNAAKVILAAGWAGETERLPHQWAGPRQRPWRSPAKTATRRGSGR
ncbi:MAG: zinc ribbon domain-containing protein [Mycobacterium sp.]